MCDANFPTPELTKLSFRYNFSAHSLFFSPFHLLTPDWYIFFSLFVLEHSTYAYFVSVSYFLAAICEKMAMCVVVYFKKGMAKGASTWS